ncbi:hypothetical protein LDENG_00155080, partial [Lucifuga dentata]
MRDVLELCKPGTLRFGVFSLDQEKAFDRVGGGLSRPVQVKRGIRQGCPLSGQLYSLAIEPMLCLLRTKLQGLTLSAAGLSNPVYLSAYADDLNIFIRNEEDVRAMEFCLRVYQKASSARVNWEKSEALLCVDWSGFHRPPLPGGLCWKDTGLKMLGVYLGSDTWVRKNWEDAVQLVEKKLTKWKWLLRQLSYRGRVLVINNLVASSLWHRLAVLNPPAGLLMEIQRKLVDFFWSGHHWLRAAVLYLPMQEGGQSLVDLESRMAAFRLQAAQRLLYG